MGEELERVGISTNEYVNGCALYVKLGSESRVTIKQELEKLGYNAEIEGYLKLIVQKDKLDQFGVESGIKELLKSRYNFEPVVQHDLL